MRFQSRSGFGLIEVLVTLACVAILVSLLAVAVMSARGAARKVTCSNRLRQVGLAMLNYESAYAVFPRGNGGGFSFQVRLLPFLEENARYESIPLNVRPMDQLGADWMSPPPPVLLCPSDPFHSTKEGDASINYVGISGGTPEPNDNGVVYGGSIKGGFKVTAASITDGLSHTLAVTESLAYLNFMHSTNAYDQRTVQTSRYFEMSQELNAFQSECFDNTGSHRISDYGLGGLWYHASIGVTRFNCVFPKQPRNCANESSLNNALFAPSSVHGDLVHGVTAAGSVHAINQTIDKELWQALGTRNGAEVANILP